MNFSTWPPCAFDRLDLRFRIVVEEREHSFGAHLVRDAGEADESLNQTTARIGSARPRTMLPASTRSAAS